MKIKLKSNNTEHYDSIEKEIMIIPREDEILILTEDGKEIATLTLTIMDGERKKKDNKYEIYPTKSFWINFTPKKSTMPGAADVFVGE